MQLQAISGIYGNKITVEYKMYLIAVLVGAVWHLATGKRMADSP